MLVLAFDTAMAACSVAVWRNGDIVAFRHVLQQRGHAETLIPMIDEVCREAGVAVRDVDRIGVTVGPGTFTGQRVGLAAARALAIGSRVEIRGTTTLRAVAMGVLEQDRGGLVAAVFDARRGEVYAQAFDSGFAALGKPQVMPPAALAGWADGLPPGEVALVGSGSTLAEGPLKAAGRRVRLSGAPDQPDARIVARWAAGAATDVWPPSPLYLRAPDAKLPGAAR